MLFRVAQEAINNTIKYVDANKIEITLTYGTNDFEMAIVDNGVGFDYDAAGFKESVGINSMYQRTKVIDGRLNIITAPDAGMSVILNMSNAVKNG
ncbi:MAG: ATP-binding protein [Taibaiella sp.]|jgi:signal transduction histidine kinase